MSSRKVITYENKIDLPKVELIKRSLLLDELYSDSFIKIGESAIENANSKEDELVDSKKIGSGLNDRRLS